MNGKKILIFLPNGIGDVLMAVPMFRRLVNAYGVGAISVVVAGSTQRDILLGIFGVSFNILCRFDGRPFGHLRLFFKIACSRFDICFAPLISNKLLNIIFFIFTFKRVVFPSSALRYSIFRVSKGVGCLNNFPGHQVNYMINFIGSNGGDIDSSEASTFELSVGGAFETGSEAKNEIVLAVGLSCGYAERHKIPKPIFFAELVNILSRDQNIKVIVFGSSMDTSLIAEFEGQLSRDVKVLKIVDEKIMNVISLLSRCDVGVTGTTGQGHMMGAAGLPLLITSGVTDPYESGPYVLRASVLKHLFPCGPCYQESYRFGCGQLACMDTLNAEIAAYEVKRLVRDKSYGLCWMNGQRKTNPLPKPMIEKIVMKIMDERRI